MDLVIKFDDLKKILQDLIDNISENNNTNIVNVSFQLKKINATINELKKNNISVPDELIKLKLTLSSQIDNVKDVERVRKELIQYLEQNTLRLKELLSEKPIKKEKPKKITIQERVSLLDLISASILIPNIEFYAYYKNNRVSATLLIDGSLETVIKKKKKVFDNPRSAAIAITGYQIDSWKFWKLDFEGKPLTLDDYRKKYFKKKQKMDIITPTEVVE